MLFIATLIFKRAYSNFFAIASLIAGMVKRYGAPSFTNEYLSEVMYNENFLGIPYMGIVLMIGRANLVLYIPLLF